jgi:hypothetical protein
MKSRCQKCCCGSFVEQHKTESATGPLAYIGGAAPGTGRGRGSEKAPARAPAWRGEEAALASELEAWSDAAEAEPVSVLGAWSDAAEAEPVSEPAAYHGVAEARGSEPAACHGAAEARGSELDAWTDDVAARGSELAVWSDVAEAQAMVPERRSCGGEMARESDR